MRNLRIWQIVAIITIIILIALAIGGAMEWALYILLIGLFVYLWTENHPELTNHRRSLIIACCWYLAHRFGLLYSLRLYLPDFWFYWRIEKWFLFFFGHGLLVAGVFSLALMPNDAQYRRVPGIILVCACLMSVVNVIYNFDKVTYRGYEKENWSKPFSADQYQKIDFLLKPGEQILVKDPDGNISVVERIDENSYPIATQLNDHPIKEKMRQLLFYELKDEEFNTKNLNPGMFCIRGLKDGGVHIRQSPLH